VLRPVQAAVIVSALERVRSRVPVEDLDVAEAQLVKLAGHLSPGELRKAAKDICDLLDSDGPQPDEDKAYARESLVLANGDNGVKFRGFLANENAELLRALIHAGARPHKTVDGELDPRPRDKRQADALTTVLTIAAAATDTGFTPAADTTDRGGADGATTDAARRAGAAGCGVDGGGGAAGSAERWVPGFGAKANITVTIDLDDLRRAAADATGGLVYGDRLSAAAIRRLACDARIIPLVLGSDSEPLDVGRSERLVTRAMRRVLNARDKGCVVCGAPPVQCDAHHLVSWLDGGVTAVSNLALLCRRHHVALHHGHWTITISNGVVDVGRPTWADPPPHHPPPHHPPPHHPPPHHPPRSSPASGSRLPTIESKPLEQYPTPAAAIANDHERFMTEQSPRKRAARWSVRATPAQWLARLPSVTSAAVHRMRRPAP
jgi:5-methylcytosine-specific restriction protein A